ncbi:hypothetical protein KW535_16370 [Vibrio fluvialis]|nr:hypothetical protein [Vibrio fluvialis]
MTNQAAWFDEHQTRQTSNNKPLNKPQITNHYQQIPFSKNKKKDHQTMAFSLKHPQKISNSPQ